MAFKKEPAGRHNPAEKKNNAMEYIIFLATIQLPFLYFIWKLFKTYQNRLLVNLRILETRIGQLRNLVETLRLSTEKASDDLEKDLEKIRAVYALTNVRLKQLEKYTGLRPNDFAPSSILKDKDFNL